MDERQIRWGLANGVTVLAIAGYFWYGVSVGVATGRVYWPIAAASAAGQIAMAVALIWAAVRLRRASGFSRADLRSASDGQRAMTRHIITVFRWTVLGQGGAVAIAVWLCLRSGATDLIWPAIGLITSLHFVPLARVFHARPYYVTAAAGSALSLAALAGVDVAHRSIWFGAGMAIVMWGSAWYVLRNASALAGQAAREPWAV